LAVLIVGAISYGVAVVCSKSSQRARHFLKPLTEEASNVRFSRLVAISIIPRNARKEVHP